MYIHVVATGAYRQDVSFISRSREIAHLAGPTIDFHFPHLYSWGVSLNYFSENNVILTLKGEGVRTVTLSLVETYERWQHSWNCTNHPAWYPCRPQGKLFVY